MPTPFAVNHQAIVSEIAAASAVLARALQVGALAIWPILSHADCIDDAAARHRVNPLVLRAIGWQESRLQPAAIGHNADGSIDVGAFQINSTHLAELARYGIDRTALLDGCVSADVAAWHYRRQVDLQGDGWQAVGAYHSHTAARAAWYANQIAAILIRWQAMPPSVLPFPAERTLAPFRSVTSSKPTVPSGLVTNRPSASSTPATFSEIAFLPPAR
jgi:soluble lytic murein transglycosylase-like protein